MFTALRRIIVLAAALCAATLFLGFSTDFASAQEPSAPTTTEVVTSPFSNDVRFGQIILDGTDQSAPVQMIRGRLASRISICQVPFF